MRNFVATLIQVLLLAILVVLINSYTYASTNSSSESVKIQEPNFPAQLYFEQGDINAVTGISKNKLSVLKSQNFFFHLNPSYKKEDIKLNYTAFPDLRYALKIYIFPFHYFW